VHDALVEFIRSGGETEVKDVNVSQYVRQLTTTDDNSDTLLHKQYQVVSRKMAICLDVFYICLVVPTMDTYHCLKIDLINSDSVTVTVEFLCTGQSCILFYNVLLCTIFRLINKPQVTSLHTAL